MYHWFAMDIEQSIDSLKQDIPEEQLEDSISQFIKGYRLEYAISDEMLKLLPIFRRYANLYGYVRILHSTKEKWDNEPDWMINLRIKLKNSLDKRKATFMMPI
jgi:Putative homoserine kinase type II (protein kinase fold)